MSKQLRTRCLSYVCFCIIELCGLMLFHVCPIFILFRWDITSAMTNNVYEVEEIWKKYSIDLDILKYAFDMYVSAVVCTIWWFLQVIFILLFSYHVRAFYCVCFLWSLFVCNAQSTDEGLYFIFITTLMARTWTNRKAIMAMKLSCFRIYLDKSCCFVWLIQKLNPNTVSLTIFGTRMKSELSFKSMIIKWLQIKVDTTNK